MQRPQRNAAWWLAHGLLNLLSYTTQDHLRSSGKSLLSWALSHPSCIKKKIPYRLAYSQSDGTIFSTEIRLPK